MQVPSPQRTVGTILKIPSPQRGVSTYAPVKVPHESTRCHDLYEYSPKQSASSSERVRGPYYLSEPRIFEPSIPRGVYILLWSHFVGDGQDIHLWMTTVSTEPAGVEVYRSIPQSGNKDHPLRRRHRQLGRSFHNGAQSIPTWFRYLPKERRPEDGHPIGYFTTPASTAYARKASPASNCRQITASYKENPQKFELIIHIENQDAFEKSILEIALRKVGFPGFRYAGL